MIKQILTASLCLALAASAVPGVKHNTPAQHAPVIAQARVQDVAQHRVSRAEHRKILSAQKIERARQARAAKLLAQKKEQARKKARAAAAERARQARLKKAREEKIAQARHGKQSRAIVSSKHSAPGGVAACIRKYESGGNYRAQNPRSSASGAYQFIDSTWRAITGRHDRAKDAPPAVQDAAFYKLWDGGRGAHHWVTASRCGY